ncbi:DUF485 domain-containing protein [Lysinibacillus sp. NPDC092081]|uniref:DUF485 domain-containing protein n=1 Tax=Lysinibacillus sp. NPDC092081 TaxID=3364131 RepID=UPI0037F633A4
MELVKEQSSVKKDIEQQDNKQIDYDKISTSEDFKQLLLYKKKFIIPYTMFYLAYSLALPFLALFTNILNVQVIGDITLAWIYGISIIFMSFAVCSVYVKKSAEFDEKVKQIIVKEGL